MKQRESMKLVSEIPSIKTQLDDIEKYKLNNNSYAYNLDNGLKNYRINKSRAIKTKQNIVFLGDSITGGASSDSLDSSFVHEFKKAIQLETGLAGFGYHSLNVFYGKTGWTELGEGTNRKTWKCTPSSQKFNFDMAFSSLYVVHGTKTDGGTVTIKIDGSVKIVNCNGENSTGNKIKILDGLSLVKHNIEIIPPTNGNGYIEGFILDGVNNGIQVHCLGHPGTTGSQNNYKDFLDCSIRAFSPILTVISYGTNDCGQQISLNNYRDALTSFVNCAKETGDALILMQGQRSDGDVLNIKYCDYVSVAKEVAKETNCAFLSVYDYWGKIQPQGFFADNVHPTQLGHTNIADLLTNILGGTILRGFINTVSVLPYNYGKIEIDTLTDLSIGLNKTMQFKRSNVAVTQGVSSQQIFLPKTLPGSNYNVIVTPNWNTNIWVTAKGWNNFTVNFSNSAPSGATIDYSLESLY